MKLAQAGGRRRWTVTLLQDTHLVIVLLLPFSGYSGGQRSCVATQPITKFADVIRDVCRDRRRLSILLERSKVAWLLKTDVWRCLAGLLTPSNSQDALCTLSCCPTMRSATIGQELIPDPQIQIVMWVLFGLQGF
jgi:hypothetical protein